MSTISLREVIRIALTSPLSHREAARAADVAPNTISRYRSLAQELEIAWEAVKELDDVALQRRFNIKSNRWSTKDHPDWSQVFKECQIKGMTLQRCWEEYSAAHADGALSYSQFTELYRGYLKKTGLTMRQHHPPGERAFVDFSGKRTHIVDPDTGEKLWREIFVGVLGCSHYLFALAVPTQQLHDWIHANTMFLEFLGGVPHALVPDNLKSAVTTCAPGLVLNRSYEEFAVHYGVVILPTRGRHPKDKAKVENGVLIMQRWILMGLRHRTFHSDAELNAAIAELVRLANERPFKKLPGCRRDLFETLDKPALRPLPAERFEFATWSAPLRVGPDYHVPVNGHYYSVPHQLRGERVEARVTPRTVELFCRRKRVASHPRSNVAGGHTNELLHMPEAHRAYAEHTPARCLEWAASIGPGVAAVMQEQFNRSVPALGLPAASSLQRLVREHGAGRVEAAAARAIQIGSLRIKSVKSLLNSPSVIRAVAGKDTASALPLHDNVRGPGYYTMEG